MNVEETGHPALCIILIVVVLVLAVLLITCILTVYIMRIQKLYHRRLVPKGQAHTYRHEQEPISYGFEYKFREGEAEAATVRSPDEAVSRVVRKSSTLEFPGLPTAVDVDVNG